MATEIICFSSGKGGTGKTVILACLGYLLQRSGSRVLFVDADVGTDGLSLFLLGPKGWEQASDFADRNTFSGFLSRFRDRAPEFEVRTANRSSESDHGQIYDVLISSRGLYGKVVEEDSGSTGGRSRSKKKTATEDASAGASRKMLSEPPPLSRLKYQEAVGALFERLKETEQWDYVLVDTRGGFSFMSADICPLADSFIIVTEADYTSLYQDRQLVARILDAAKAMGQEATLRGVFVNKATEGLSDKNKRRPAKIDLDRIEAGFRTQIAADLGIKYAQTYPVPADLSVVLSYKNQRIPYLDNLASLFSYATVRAFSDMLGVVTVRWPKERALAWNEFVDETSKAIRAASREHIRHYRKERRAGALQTVVLSLGGLLAISALAAGIVEFQFTYNWVACTFFDNCFGTAVFGE